MEQTMRAIVLDGPGPVESLKIRDVPIPLPKPGWVRIRVKAFGINRSELHTRLGFAGEAVTYPRVLGIEATGVIDLDPSGTLVPGQQVVTMMGGMGRSFDGGYAEYTCVPLGQVIPFTSNLGWESLGAVPEMLQTAYGSLNVGMDFQAGQSILIRGGTSSIGMAAVALAKRQGAAAIFATTRNPAKAGALRRLGVDHVLIDDGGIAAQIRAILPGGVDSALELVGTPTLQDTLRAVRVHGTVCFSGMLSNQWTVKDFYPIEYLPKGVRLTAYSGGPEDLPADILQAYLDDAQRGMVPIPVDEVFSFERIHDAHRKMESGAAAGKLVVLTER
ncbi:zinc-binding alcohol dehydrogenase family protein [Glutamicibacter sp. NPDC127525]|uniref:zinc-binding alcohol dehydrogenase family protein n=1 Tax=unclassified Glutamicibacter TaxID=2627139 RepID=UPI0036268FB9